MSKNKRKRQRLEQKLSNIDNNHNNKVYNKSSVKINHPQSNDFQFASMYPWIKSTKYKKKFHNVLKDENDFAFKIYKIMVQIIPIIYKESKTIFSFNKQGQYKHCHPINQPDKIKIVEQVSYQLHNNDFSNIADDNYQWWQVGFVQGIRIVGIYTRSENTFYPLFCDWHHMLFPDVKHNDVINNTKNNNFKPQDNYKI